jgi:hypothetical protein
MKSLFALTVAAALTTAAQAADIRVSYLVDSKPLKTLAVAGAPFTFALFADAACATPVALRAVNVELLTLVEQLKVVKVKGAPRVPTPARLEHVLTDVPLVPVFYLTVTGPGVTPIGGACQLQQANVNGGSVVPAPPLTCPPDSSRVGSGTPCVDRYEGSVWDIPPSNTTLIQKVKDGTATLGDLTGGGATQIGATLDPPIGCAPSYPVTFPQDGNFSAALYAASVPGVKPSACLTAYQAAVACQLSGKRLLSSAEWLAAATGTPDTNVDDGATDCNTNAGGAGANAPVNTGSRSACVSPGGMFDAISNVYEWTVDRNLDVLSGAPNATTWIRGGDWGDGVSASASRASQIAAASQVVNVGFRCAR